MRRIRLPLAMVLAVALFPAAALACIWVYQTDLHGHARVLNDSGPEHDSVLEAHADRTDRRARLEKLRPELKGKAETGDYRDRNDYAAVLTMLGELPEAIEILTAIEAENPKQYATAVNLGTAYELQGDLPKALEWTKLGIERNSDAHYGTEWLHVQILEAELKLAEDPAWLQTHSVLGLDFGKEVTPVSPMISQTDAAGKPLSLESVESATRYQLHERIGLVPPPNAVVADLLADLGNLYVLNRSLERAIPIYELALEYRPTHPEIVQKRVGHFRKLVAANPKSLQRTMHPGVKLLAVSCVAVVVAVPAAIVLGIFLARRRMKKRSTAT
jgi:tetratricopeptide (TPR) repeat protein